MPRTRTSLTLSIASIPILAASLAADEPSEPLKPGEHPNDWQCTYAISETTCARVIDAWADDYLDDPSTMKDLVTCSNCEPVTMNDHLGNPQTIGYHCENRLGYEVLTKDREAKIPIYQNASGGQGWKVTDWVIHRCLRTWECYDFCAFDRETPRCLVTTVIAIGRFQPVLDGICDPNPMPPKSEPEGANPSDSDTSGELGPDSGYPSDIYPGGGRDTGWY